MNAQYGSIIGFFCEQIGAEEVWRSWRNAMLAQDREVPPERMEWETLPERDKMLDRAIAESVIMHFLSYVTAQGQIVPPSVSASS